MIPRLILEVGAFVIALPFLALLIVAWVYWRAVRP
jgi:hypothetical protein